MDSSPRYWTDVRSQLHPPTAFPPVAFPSSTTLAGGWVGIFHRQSFRPHYGVDSYSEYQEYFLREILGEGFCGTHKLAIAWPQNVVTAAWPFACPRYQFLVITNVVCEDEQSNLEQNVPPSCTDFHAICEPQTPWTLRACPGLYRDCFTFTFYLGGLQNLSGPLEKRRLCSCLETNSQTPVDRSQHRHYTDWTIAVSVDIHVTLIPAIYNFSNSSSILRSPVYWTSAKVKIRAFPLSQVEL